MVRCLLLVVVMLSAVSSFANDMQATMNSIGPVKVGMTIAEAEGALNRKLVAEESFDSIDGCLYYGAGPEMPGVAFMSINGVILRYDVFGHSARTLSGVAVGDAVERVFEIYGAKLDVTPHYYSGPEESYLTIWSKDRKSAIRFETSSGKIQSFYGGNSRQVQYVEGCL